MKAQIKLGDRSSNKEIAERVRSVMKSETTDKSIAWYKNKINRGIIKVNKSSCAWLNKSEPERSNETISNVTEEEIISNEAKRHVYELEYTRTGKYPIKMKSNNGPGYDFDSGDRHIEVKGAKKKNKTWEPEHIEWYISGTISDDESSIEKARLKKGMFIIATNELDTQTH